MQYVNATKPELSLAREYGVSFKGRPKCEAMKELREAVLLEQFQLAIEKGLEVGDRVEYCNSHLTGEILHIIRTEGEAEKHLSRSVFSTGAIVLVEYRTPCNGIRVRWIKPVRLTKVVPKIE